VQPISFEPNKPCLGLLDQLDASPDAALRNGTTVLANLRQLLRAQNFSSGRNAGSQRLATWIKALDSVDAKIAAGLKTVIAVVGATGAGKSSTINAVLGHENLVPSNCLRACTSVVTELSYHDNDQIKAEVEVRFRPAYAHRS
jgi:ABC-type glutathione transport system ATPase component